MPLRQVQEWRGHSTITMTMRHSHLAPGTGAERIGVLETPNASVSKPTAGKSESCMEGCPGSGTTAI